MLRLLFALLTVCVVFSVIASSESPYKGQQSRAIKALSADEIAGFESGGGMGYAKAAELNSYPGPRHVLELSEELNLSADQIARTQAIFDRMKARASELGMVLVAQERELDQRFASGSIDRAALHDLVAEISAIEADIRVAHLGAHLEQKSVLSAHQVKRYDDLRGYADGQSHDGHHGH